jgi:uncharacterized membrane protein YhaH (DUF805 family)
VFKFLLIGIGKLFNIPQLKSSHPKMEKVRKSFSDYFGQAGNIWGKANRLDYLIGYLWSMGFAFIINFIFIKTIWLETWQYLQQFNANRPYDGTPIHYTAPNQSLTIGLILLVVFNLYWIVPYLTLNIRRCRSMGSTKIFFVLFAPFGGIILAILGVLIPGRQDEDEALKVKLREEYKRDMSQQMARDYYADRD